MHPMDIIDVAAPMLVIIGAIALVAVAYLAITALKDRYGQKSDDDPLF